MDSFRLSKSATTERAPLLGRRSMPDMSVNSSAKRSLERDLHFIEDIKTDKAAPLDIPKSKKPKLTVEIPSVGRASAEYVGERIFNSPILQTGVVNTGEYDTGAECVTREDWITALQYSGDSGPNDYLHWYTYHPYLTPLYTNDMCPCWDSVEEDVDAEVDNIRETVERTKKAAQDTDDMLEKIKQQNMAIAARKNPDGTD